MCEMYVYVCMDVFQARHLASRSTQVQIWFSILSGNDAYMPMHTRCSRIITRAKEHVFRIHPYLHATWLVHFLDVLSHHPQHGQFAPVLYDIWRLQRGREGEIVDAWVSKHISTEHLVCTRAIVGVGVWVCVCVHARACACEGCVRMCLLHNLLLRCVAAHC